MTKRVNGAATKPRKSGANIPDSQRHTLKLQLRVQPETMAQLDALCVGVAAPWTRSDFVSALIDSETRRKARRKTR